jgi:UPF0755 protein
MQPKTTLYLFGAVLFLGMLHYLLLSPPRTFPIGQSISIPPGTSLQKASYILKEQKVIRSRIAFEFFIISMGAEKHLKPAFYTFSEKLPVFGVAWRIGGGKFRMAPVVVTVPEGYSSAKMKPLFAEKLPNFNQELFLESAAEKEGYLFPDTYFFLNTDSEKEVIRSLSENFYKKIEPLESEIEASEHSLSEIVIMASILEGEAKGDNDLAIISGILWKRLSINMPLQADAAPVTYEERGLPPKPIGNPGLKTITAALRPEQSAYLYYLHDKDGQVHFAKNFAEHRSNIEKYLK